MSSHKNWEKMWRSPEPKNSYDAIIIGGGGHGLGTAYYLAKEHGPTCLFFLKISSFSAWATQPTKAIVLSLFFFVTLPISE